MKCARTWVLTLGLVVAAGNAGAEAKSDLATLGVVYELQNLSEPRPNRVHVLRVDLAAERVRPVVMVAPDPDGAGPAEATLTDPRELADHPAVVAFVNTNPWDSLPDASGSKNRSWFEGQPVDILGLAASGGAVRSPAGPGEASAWVDQSGRFRLGEVPAGNQVVEGIAGFQPVVRKGVLVSDPGGPMHPRTAIGSDSAGQKLWLVVVDGRQAKFSEGMTLHELGKVMLELGCWWAINLDGGGSSVMGLIEANGRLRVVNSPSDRLLGGISKVRPVPIILTLQRKPPEGIREK